MAREKKGGSIYQEKYVFLIYDDLFSGIHDATCQLNTAVDLPSKWRDAHLPGFFGEDVSPNRRETEPQLFFYSDMGLSSLTKRVLPVMK